MYKEYEEINKAIENALALREKQKTALEQNAETNNEIILKANEDIFKATTEGDLKTYKAAKKAKDEAIDALNLFRGKLEQLEDEALVSDEEGAELLKKIHSLQNIKLQEMLQQLKPVLDQVDTIATSAFSYIEEGNNLIAKWHTHIKPFKKLLGMNNGKPIYQNALPSFTDYRQFKEYVDYIKNLPQFRLITEAEEGK